MRHKLFLLFLLGSNYWELAYFQYFNMNIAQFYILGGGLKWTQQLKEKNTIFPFSFLV